MSKKDSWICKNCSETLEKEFDSCWNCGTSKDGKLDGPFKIYYNNGQLWYQGTYKDGESVSETTSWK
tara:strand:+ start:353 stop:553 length:201 start_codon:yes stop_codon:yes gene_type:complete